MVATDSKEIKQSILCVTVAYLRDITDMIFVHLHLNVNHLRVCFSCFNIHENVGLCDDKRYAAQLTNCSGIAET